ncbi:MAG: M1 family aminopeptidase [Bacteroidota bacterium]|nr:M1 family aminopeptidase [Bacteroidota bacterium]
MKFLIYSLIISVFLHINTVTAQEDGALTCAHTKQMLMQKLKPEKQVKYRTNPYYGYDVKFWRLDLNIDPGVYEISGSVTVYFQVTTDGFDQMFFDLQDNMTVSDIQFHESSLSYTHTGDEIQVTLPGTIPSGTLDSLTIDYEGVPENSGFGSFMQDYHNGNPIIWTLSEPYGAKTWWPCKQSLDDKADSVDIIVHMPVGNKAASNGLLVSEEITGDIKTDIWQHRHPITTYLIAVAVTNYDVYSDYAELGDGSSVEILNYVYPENLLSAQEQTPDVIDVLEFFSTQFIDYPYKDEKYGHAQFGWGGGMEHQTMSFMGGFSHRLMAHELAHQWFGDYVTCGSWEDIWLNEGFATYLEGMTIEQGLDNGAYEDFSEWREVKIASIISDPGGSVFVDDTTSVSRIFNSRLSYSKGAMVLHMLRQTVGDEVFFLSLQNYLTDPEIADGYATTPQLKNHFEAVYPESLDYFFQDWIYNEGYPIYSPEFNSNSSSSGILTLEQTSSHNSVDFFALPVPVLFQGAGSVDSLIVFDNTFSGEEFSVDLDFDITNIIIDPASNLVASYTEIAYVEPLSNSSFKLYPNPVNEVFTIKKLSGDLINEIEVVNLSGKVIEVVSFNDLNGEYIEVDVSKLSSGVYFVKIATRHNQVVKKLIIE